MKKAGMQRPAFFAYHLLWQAIDWLYPPHCAGCDRLGERWCATCQQQVGVIGEEVCPVCGDVESGQALCPACQDHPPAYRALRSWGAYSGTLRNAIHRLKYKGDIGLAEPLSKHLIAYYNQLNWNVDFVIPVPLGLARARQRGYNQSSLLARPLAHALQIPYKPACLQRNRETRSQVGLSAHQRRENVYGAFRANHEQVSGRIILLVDDVTTTGSTINACAQALSLAGASAVYGLTLARSVLQADADGLPNLS
jgi:ComF family protein